MMRVIVGSERVLSMKGFIFDGEHCISPGCAVFWFFLELIIHLSRMFLIFLLQKISCGIGH
jgi:hypothetical protein